MKTIQLYQTKREIDTRAKKQIGKHIKGCIIARSNPSQPQFGFFDCFGADVVGILLGILRVANFQRRKLKNSCRFEVELDS